MLLKSGKYLQIINYMLQCTSQRETGARCKNLINAVERHKIKLHDWLEAHDIFE